MSQKECYGIVVEIFFVPFENRTDMEGVTRKVVVVGIFEKFSGTCLKLGVEDLTFIGFRDQNGAAFGGTIDGKMDAGFTELDSDDVVFDIVEAIGIASQDGERDFPRTREQSAYPAYR